MSDLAHRKTDLKLEKMEKRLSAIYSRAEKEIQKTAEEYFSKFAKQDEAKRKLLEQGKITEDEYKKWRKGKVMYGKRFTEMKEQCAKQLLNVNQTALAYVNGELPEVYAINYNALADSVDGVGGYSFTLVDADTVRNLAVTDTSLLPYKEIDPSKDIPWNMKKINAETLQGILQGESMDKIAKRLRNVQEMNKTQAIRSARTIVTGAENKGRQDSYARAEADGIILQKEWISTNDSRTRHSHAALDGAIVDQDKKFDNGLMYPGDPNGRPEETWNCRCTVAAVVKGFKKAQVQKAMDEKQVEERQASAFTPAKTVQEAEKYAKNELNFEVAKFGETTVDVANEINRVIGVIFDKYPEIEIDRIISGQTNARYTLAMHKTNLVQKTGKLTKGTLEIGNIQRKSFSEVENILSKSVKSGFFVKTDAGYLETRIWHEAGHQYGSYIESELFKKRFPDFETNDKAYTSYLKEVLKKQFYKDVFKESKADMKRRGLVFDVKNISQYASTNQSEMFAEAFAEINCSKNPSEESKTIVKIAMEKLK